jgi:hypothetical protein
MIRRPSPVRAIALAVALLACGVSAAWAGAADVIRVEVRKAAPGVYDFDVTVRSDDTGGDHFADRFEVLTLDGTMLGTRELLHPHEEEQPFTRDLRGLHLPAGIHRVVVRAHHKTRGYDGMIQAVTLPR